ncbi:MAG: hypothetical protein Q8L92_09020 [Rubrivivax sp.]|nr:hypothetical protein [Rubrivivax sp.]
MLALATALSAHDAVAIDREACELHRALAAAIQHFGQAARSGGIPAALRQRLAHAGASVAAQREALARATAALDRAIDVLIPSAPASATYAASGNTDRAGGLAGAYLSA